MLHITFEFYIVYFKFNIFVFFLFFFFTLLFIYFLFCYRSSQEANRLTQHATFTTVVSALLLLISLFIYYLQK